MYRVAVVDDQKTVRDRIGEFFDRYAREQGQQFQLTFYESAVSFLDQYRPKFDLVLMDIDMPGMNGMEAAHRLRELDEAVVLMFITNLAGYAINGYEVNAVDFVVKPVDYDRFAFKITRVLRFVVPDREDKSVLIRTENGTVTMDPKNITYVEVEGHSLYYHTVKQTYRVRGTLKQAEEELPAGQFFLCNKCYLVNLACVQAISGSDITVGGETVLVSRTKKKPFMEALAAYHNG